ncbi:MAG: PAS domain-containing protein [Ktedonobacterales bacterium]|nr:PAS domain-containing protein [Ktedonobacterales bacterium]
MDSVPEHSGAGVGNDLASGDESALAGGGATGALMRTIDWSATPIGPVERWPQSLRTAVRICLDSRFPLLIWWGPELVMLYNDAYRPILGTTKHPDAMGQAGRACWPEIWETIGPMLHRVMTTGEATWSDDQLLPLDRNGYVEECYFTFSYSPIRDESGRVAGIFTAVTETTARVLSERRMRALRELATATANTRSAEDACAIAATTLAAAAADLPFALLYLLDAEARQATLAGSTGLVPHAPPRRIILTDQEKHTAEWPLAQVLATGQPRLVADVAAHFGSAVGGNRAAPHSALLLPIAQPGQEHAHGVLVAGISPRRALDDEYRGFFSLVAGQVATAVTNARAYEEERRRTEALIALDRAKTDFFSNVSHEFRTPLTLLLGPLEEVLAEGAATLSPTQRERLEMARRNGLRLYKLVNTLLDFSRIEAGRLAAASEPTDLATLTAELASTFRSAIERAGLRLVVECPPLGQPVAIDQDLWEKVVLNLLSNAYKHTFEGEIRVRLRQVGTAVELEVRDTGTGIAAADLPHIFERFYRARGARARTHEGTGIGLALVRELIHLHGGEVRVASTLDQGSTFTVRIPLGSAHVAAAHSNTAPPLTSTALGAAPYVEEAERWLTSASGLPTLSERSSVLAGAPRTNGARPAPRARILLADDNADMREYVARLLGQRWLVTAVGDGAAALAASRAHPPDLVVADVLMPRMDGFQLLRALRDEPRTRAVPVLLLSARAGEEATIEGLEAGADDYLVKPFSARELLARVNAHLELARLASESAARVREMNAVFDAIADALFIFDHEGHILRDNAAARALLGAGGRADLLPTTLADQARALRPRSSKGEPLEEAHWPGMRVLGGEVITGARARDVLIRTLDGRDVLINCTGAPLVDAAGRGAGGVMVARDVTERQKLERDAAERASQLEAIIDAMTDGVSVYDSEGRIVHSNAALRDLLGIRADPAALDHAPSERGRPIVVRDAEGHPLLEEEWMLWRALRGEVLRGANARDITLRAQDGRDVRVSVTGGPVRDPAGEIVGGVGVLRDVTERHRLEREIAGRAAELEAIFGAMADGVMVFDGEGRVLRLNGAAQTLLGLEADAARYGRPLRERGYAAVVCDEAGQPLPQERWPYVRVLRGEVLTGANAVDVIYRLGDRPEIQVNLNGAPILDAAGTVIGAVCVLRDVTERRRLERRTQEALDALLEMAGVLVEAPAHAEPDEREIGARSEAAARRLADLTRSVLGCERVAVVALDPGAGGVRPITVAGVSAAEEGRWRAELREAHLADYLAEKDTAALLAGQVVLVDLTPSPRREAAFGGVIAALAPMHVGERLIGVVAIDYGAQAHEYTPEELALTGAVAKLMALVIERDRLLRERARAEARMLGLEEANRRMGEFLGIAGHELRTPLTVIKANVQLLGRSASSVAPSGAPRDASLINRTERQVDRLNRLVSDLVDVSRIKEGKLELRLEPCDLAALLRETVDEQRMAQPEHVIHLRLPRDLRVPVVADADRIGQVVTNFLTNALKYSREEQPVWVGLEVLAGGARVWVRDRGPGIPRNEQAHIWELFHRAQGIEVESGSGIGLGLGLYICQTIITRHGGAVGVRSTVGKGSTFWFTLPRTGPLASATPPS